MSVKAIPEGYNTVTPYIMVKDCRKLIKFVENVFAAKLNHAMENDEGLIMHGEIQIGTSRIMISEATEKNPATPVMLYLYLPDVDGIYSSALKHGATSIMEPQDTFYGDRNAGVMDDSGNKWWIAKHIKDVSEEELRIGAQNKQNEIKQNCI